MEPVTLVFDDIPCDHVGCWALAVDETLEKLGMTYQYQESEGEGHSRTMRFVGVRKAVTA